MSQLSSRKDQHPNCNACDFQKLKELENNPAIRKLRDKIELLNFKLAECKNENQMLKRNLQLAKKMVYQEVGGTNVDFQSLMKHGTGEGCKGRQESVLVLKKRVQELKDYLRELEGDPPEALETPSEEYSRYQLPTDKKKFWRMELERRLARESAEKDINPLVQECYELRKGLDNEKNRFKELSEEVKLLQAELQSQVAKNEEDIGLVSSFKTLEKQLHETLAERAEIRQELDSFRSRNKNLTEELGFLKKELDLLHSKTSENNDLISSLTNSHKAIQESIDVEKAIVQQNIDRYKEDLEVLTKNHAKDVEILDQLQSVMCSRNCLIDDLRKDVDDGLLATEKSKQALEKVTKKELKSGSVNKLLPSKGSKTLHPISSRTRETDSAEAVTSENKAMSKTHKVRLECEKYKTLCEAARRESAYFLNVIASQEKLMNDIASQVVETGQLAIQKNAEKKDLLDKINRLQQSLSTRRKKNIPTKTRLDEIRIKCEAQKDENDFLRNFLHAALRNKEEDIDFFKECTADHKHFFQESLKNIEVSLKSEQPSHQSQELVTSQED